LVGIGAPAGVYVSHITRRLRHPSRMGGASSFDSAGVSLGAEKIAALADSSAACAGPRRVCASAEDAGALPFIAGVVLFPAVSSPINRSRGVARNGSRKTALGTKTTSESIPGAWFVEDPS
jgi:hypothetical protein